MKVFAARYMLSENSKLYDVVAYYTRKQADDEPHDYPFAFTPKDWRKLGCRVPRKDETMAVELMAKELPAEKEKRR